MNVRLGLNDLADAVLVVSPPKPGIKYVNGPMLFQAPNGCKGAIMTESREWNILVSRFTQPHNLKTLPRTASRVTIDVDVNPELIAKLPQQLSEVKIAGDIAKMTPEVKAAIEALYEMNWDEKSGTRRYQSAQKRHKGQ